MPEQTTSVNFARMLFLRFIVIYIKIKFLCVFVYSHPFLTEKNSSRDNQKEYATSPHPKRQRLGRKKFSVNALKKLLKLILNTFPKMPCGW